MCCQERIFTFHDLARMLRQGLSVCGTQLTLFAGP
jgi:hypothetical protein